VFDNNPYLFAFNNKIYDLKLGQFIEPRPEFYITTTSGYDYVPNTDQTEVMGLLKTILAPEVLVDFLTTMATGLCGFQMENLVIETGCGRNGKGLTSSLMMATVGGYGYTLPSSTLLNEIKTGANPEIANLNNKRYVVSSEPPKNKKINCATMKSLTGDKTINARGLYSSKTDTKLCLTLVLECNDLPLLDEVIVAVVQRLRVIPFNNTFVSPEEYEKLDECDRVNVGITNPYYKTEEFQHASRCAFFDILCEYFKGFAANSFRLRPQPKACLDKCRDYLAVRDNIFSWFAEFHEKSEDCPPLTLSDIYNKFKDGEVYSNFSKLDKRKYSRKYFCEQLEKNLFMKQYIKLRDTRFNGVQLKHDCIVGWKEIKDEEEAGGQMM
jgi:P4 family phage/plasmid primase-like protien